MNFIRRLFNRPEIISEKEVERLNYLYEIERAIRANIANRVRKACINAD